MRVARFGLVLLVMACLTAPSAAQADAPLGAASCSGCHAADPKVRTSIPKIAGRKAAELVTLLQAYRDGTAPSTVMGRIAKGFTPDELSAIAAWYAGQTRPPE